MDLGSKRTSLVIFQNSKVISLNLFSAETCQELSGRLDSFLSLLGQCSHLFCEQQMTTNHKAQKIQAWIEMWALNRLTFVIFPARLKYDGLKLGKYSVRKKWAVKTARHYLQREPEMLRQFELFKPQADVADALVIGLCILGFRPSCPEFWKGQ